MVIDRVGVNGPMRLSRDGLEDGVSTGTLHQVRLGVERFSQQERTEHR